RRAGWRPARGRSQRAPAQRSAAPRKACVLQVVAVDGGCLEERKMKQATDTKEHLFELLRDFDTTMLVTVDNDGGLHARPMAVASLEPDGDTYLVTSIESPKVAEVEHYPQVTLTFQSNDQYA